MSFGTKESNITPPRRGDADRDIEILMENTTDPYSIDYIFQKEYENLSAEEIVD